VEIRALAIAFFYAAGTAIGGVGAPFLFGGLIATGSRANVFGGYLLGSALMVLAKRLIISIRPPGRKHLPSCSASVAS